MITVGLVGENPSDTTAIERLLAQSYTELAFLHLLSGIVNGSMLDNDKMIKRLRREVEIEKPDIVLFIRDVDALETDKDYTEKLQKRKEYYSKCKRLINQRKEISEDDSLFLLNIYELEALILADIESCNAYYGVEIILENPPMLQHDPKGFLKTRCNYKESDTGIFSKLNIEIVQQNCPYFAQFIQKWDIILSQKK